MDDLKKMTVVVRKNKFIVSFEASITEKKILQLFLDSRVGEGGNYRGD